MSTAILLLAGATAFTVFLAVVALEGARRPGYDPRYHTGSELALGERGWIQRASFLLTGCGVLAFAAGVERALDSTAAAILLAVFGLGLMVSGVFAPDAVRGFPPGSARDADTQPTRAATIHNLAGPLAFAAVFAACLAVAERIDGAWRVYTLATAATGLAMTVWTAVAFKRDAANTGLVQRGLLVVYWGWFVALGVHLAGGAAGG